jgi:SAM-dependent methyltransferase
MEAAAYRQFQALEEHHWWFRGRRAVYLALLRHHLDGTRPRRVLDLGCGVGGFLPGLTEIGERVVAVDLDRASLAMCRERGFPLGVVSDGYALPFQDASFELVCLFDALEHIPDDQRAALEVARCLAPGGLLVATVPAYPFLYANNDRVARHCRRYTRGALRRVLEGAGLTVERLTHTNVLLFPMILPTVLALKAYERLFRRTADPDRTNLSFRLPRAVHDLLARVFAAELVVSRHRDWPAGHSILCLARKPRSQSP